MLARIARRAQRRTPRIINQIISFDQTQYFSSAKNFVPHIVDEHNTIIGGYTPVTKQLWAQRYKWDRESLASALPQSAFLSKPSIKTEVPYPFSKDPVLREYFRNPWGGVRIGLLLEDMDSMAGFTAYQHIDDGDNTTLPPVLVTATVEAIHFNQPILHLNKDMKLSGRVVWTGKSSMDIVIEVRQEEGDGSSVVQGKNESLPNISALFTFVARHPVTGKAHQINPVDPEDAKGKALFAQRQAIAAARKAQRRAEALAEHKYTAEHVAFATDLLSHAHLKRDLPALANPSAIFMPQTALENTITSQPQNRNVHGRIFGGFLMRRAFELAHSTSYLLAASRPRTVAIDEIQFKRPVDVGDLVRFRSRVLRAWNDPKEPARGFVHVQVAASVVKPEAVQSYETNTFNFVFEVERRRRRRRSDGNVAPHSGGSSTGHDTCNEEKSIEEILVPLPEILPTTEEEANEICVFHGPGSDQRRARWFSATAVQ